MPNKLSDYNFDFPSSLIAQESEGKGKTHILYCKKENNNSLQILKSSEIEDLFTAGDCIVVNNTKVIPARLFGKTANGSKVEILLIKPLNDDSANDFAVWEAWVRPGKAFDKQKEVYISNVKCKSKILDNKQKNKVLEFSISNKEFAKFLAENGNVPLPPYINRDSTANDKIDYQSIFAKNAGAVAAPTASLHFSEEMVKKIKAKGVNFAEVTLHVGPGTFENIKETEDFTKHKIHSEEYEITEENAATINKCKDSGGRIICIGTTSMRVLESVANENGFVKASKGITDIFIYPGFKFKTVNALLTNFHWPASSLILLVSAFYGKENTLNAYKYAVENKMKLFSYGDGMLII